MENVQEMKILQKVFCANTFRQKIVMICEGEINVPEWFFVARRLGHLL